MMAGVTVRAEPPPAAPSEPSSTPAAPSEPSSTPVAPRPAPPPKSAQDEAQAQGGAATAPSRPAASTDSALVEACDGSRRRPTQDVRTLSCGRWIIAWQEGGTPWGFVAAESYEAVLAERERQLAFARQYARFFEVPLDEGYGDPSPPICETCERSGPAGRWGQGQKFGDAAAREALGAAEAELAALDAALDEHMPRLTDAARLSHDPAVGKAARAYAKQLRQGVLSLAKLRFALDNAGVLRSERAAKEAGRAATAQVEALTASLATLRSAVGKEVGKAHAGRYHEEGTTGADRPQLEIALDGAAVTATYVVGAAKSTWFHGTVELDGSIAGRSLLAPDDGTLTCAQHSEECGYVYIPAMLRFTERVGADEKPVQTAELWFQRASWVMAKPFTRPRGQPVKG